MIRMPAYLSNDCRPVRRTCPGVGKTAAQMACAVEVYKTPLHRRAIYAFCRWGWAIVPAVLALSALTGCDDLESYAADQASLADAIAQAAKEAGK